MTLFKTKEPMATKAEVLELAKTIGRMMAQTDEFGQTIDVELEAQRKSSRRMEIFFYLYLLLLAALAVLIARKRLTLLRR